MNKKRILVVTSARSDFSILSGLIIKLKKNKRFITKILASGSHYSKKHGLTINEFSQNNLKADFSIPLNYRNDSIKSNLSNISKVFIGFSNLIMKNSFDIVILLGDRYETFAFAIAANFFKLPIAHIHGGELSMGALDDAMRHSITKLSHIHFVSTSTYKKRVIQLGEIPQNVHNVGSLGVENLKSIKLLSKNSIEKKLKIKFKKNNILVTFHPETLENNTFSNLIQLLNALKKLQNYLIIFTRSNADNENNKFTRKIIKFINKNKNSIMFNSLGAVNYFSVIKQVDFVIGNSSSGVIEIPSMKIPTINVGNRQNGRIKSSSVIDCEPLTENIIEIIKKVRSKKFIKQMKKIKNPYDKNNVASNIVKILENLDFKDIIKKEFYNLQKI